MCHVNLPVQLPEMFKPDPDDVKTYCQSERFRLCPRFQAVQAPSGGGGGGSGGSGGATGSGGTGKTT